MPSSARLKKMPTGEGLTFEKVWAMFQETAERQRETDRQMKETDLQFKETKELMKESAERQKETDLKFKETAERMRETDLKFKETAERMRETDRRIGELGNRFGELAEHLVAPGIMDKFNELGFHFTQVSKDFSTRDPQSRETIAEVDIMLENGDIVIAVEVKSKPKKSDADEHVRRMEKLRYAADLRKDKRRYRGALAGAIMSTGVREHALKLGLYVIEQTGDTVKIVIPRGFKPCEW
jgi:hypothetical protein